MEWPACWVEGNIGLDQGQKLVEQIEATVDIADRINPLTCGYRRLPPEHLELPNFSKRKRHISTQDCQRIVQRLSKGIIGRLSDESPKEARIIVSDAVVLPLIVHQVVLTRKRLSPKTCRPSKAPSQKSIIFN